MHLRSRQFGWRALPASAFAVRAAHAHLHRRVPAVDVELHADEDEISIGILDHGIGLDLAKVREAMDLFGQVNREKLEQQGGGLGLAIANRFALINKGRLSFANRPEGGAIISLILPRILKK